MIVTNAREEKENDVEKKEEKGKSVDNRKESKGRERKG